MGSDCISSWSLLIFLLCISELLWLCRVVALKSLPVHSFNALIIPILRGCLQSLFNIPVPWYLFDTVLKVTSWPAFVSRCIIRWVGRQTQWWPRHKAIYFSWFGPELFCLLLGPPGFNCWFSSAPVFQWCCSTPQGSPGVGRNTFLSSPHLCFIIGFICDLFVTRDDPLMS